MRKKQNIRKITLFISAILLGIFVGCAPTAKYSFVNPPLEKTESFKIIEVSKVEVGVTSDELEPETPIEIRSLVNFQDGLLEFLGLEKLLWKHNVNLLT